jgi:hypothetical protein
MLTIQEFDYRRVLRGHGDVLWSAKVPARLDVCALFEERLHDLHVTFASRDVQRSLALTNGT